MWVLLLSIAIGVVIIIFGVWIFFMFRRRSSENPNGQNENPNGQNENPNSHVTVSVRNNCATDLWIRGENNPFSSPFFSFPANVNGRPTYHKLASNTSENFQVPNIWEAGRINAYYRDPNVQGNENAFDKVEATFDNSGIHYNITYVDYISLPSKMQAIGEDCEEGPACNQTRNFILSQCPVPFREGDRCLSAGTFCLNIQNQNHPTCKALRRNIDRCSQLDPNCTGTTPEVYACTNNFSSGDGVKWCAALNRNILDMPETTNSSTYYQNPLNENPPPYNTYAKWIHEVCPNIYAFPYDDFPSNSQNSGFRSCRSNRLEVTFCPVG